jgi:hypothetical protein
MGYGHRSQNESHDCCGPAKAYGSKAKPTVGLEPPRATRVRDEEKQRVANSWCTWCPVEGTQHPQASYLSPSREVSFMPLCVGWHLAVHGFSLGITWQSRLKPPDPNLIGLGNSPCLLKWRGTCPSWLSPMNGDPRATRILTRHCGAMS